MQVTESLKLPWEEAIMFGRPHASKCVDISETFAAMQRCLPGPDLSRVRSPGLASPGIVGTGLSVLEDKRGLMMISSTRDVYCWNHNAFQLLARAHLVNSRFEDKSWLWRNYIKYALLLHYFNLILLIDRRAGIERELASRADQRVLRSFGHEERMDEHRMVRRVMMAEVIWGRVRGRPRLGWMDGEMMALSSKVMTVEAARQCAKDRKEWRALVHM